MIFVFRRKKKIRDFGFAEMNGRSSGSRPQPPKSGSVLGNREMLHELEEYP
jgi:hypothetical protein